MNYDTSAVGIARVSPSRPGLLARWRRPAPAELVQVAIVGHPTAVTAVARALATVTAVTGMSHHVQTDANAADQAAPVMRLDVTCHPTRRIEVGR